MRSNRSTTFEIHFHQPKLRRHTSSDFKRLLTLNLCMQLGCIMIDDIHERNNSLRMIRLCISRENLSKNFFNKMANKFTEGVQYSILLSNRDLKQCSYINIIPIRGCWKLMNLFKCCQPYHRIMIPSTFYATSPTPSKYLQLGHLCAHKP